MVRLVALKRFNFAKSLQILFIFIEVFSDVILAQRCGAVLREFGQIRSALYPEKYPSNYDCTWTIEARAWDTVSMKFDHFKIEPSEDCEYDHVLITWSEGSEKFCGNKMNKVGDNGYLTTKGRTTIKMFSDKSVEDTGFSMRFEVTRNEMPESMTTTLAPTTTTKAETLANAYNSCADKPCQNGGECVDVEEGLFICFCEDGFEGDFCEINLDDCTSNPCLNGGTCLDGANEWSCDCVPGYVGETCAIDIDECKVEPCKNDAVCIDRINSFECICPDGYTGWDCSIEIDECESSPCKNYGVCEDHLGHFTCVCHPKYTGPTCEISLEPTTTTALATTAKEDTTIIEATTQTPIIATTQAQTEIQTTTTQESTITEEPITPTKTPVATTNSTNTPETTIVSPVAPETTTQKPNTSETTTQEPNTSETTTQEPNTSETTTQKPNTSETTTQEPNTSETTTQEPNTSEITNTLGSTHSTDFDVLLKSKSTTELTISRTLNSTQSPISDDTKNMSVTNTSEVFNASNVFTNIEDSDESEKMDLTSVIASLLALLGAVFSLLLVWLKKKGYLSGDKGKVTPTLDTLQNAAFEQDQTDSSSSLKLD